MKEFLKTEIISTGSFNLTVGQVLNTLIIFVLTYLLIRFITSIITRIFNRRAQNDGRHYSVIQLVRYIIWTMAVVFMMQTLGINITFLIAGSAALLVGIGLGLQNVFKDFISGVVLLIEGTINVNDIVEVDGLVVRVNEISIRTSKVTTRDDNIVIIPNHKFVEEKIVNWTKNMQPTRFSIEVGVDYSSDAHLVEKILIECAVNHKDVLHEKDFYPSVRLKEFSDSSLNFQLIFFSYKLFRNENVKSKIRFMILDAFRKNNITIPFPQRVVHYAGGNSKEQ